MPRVDHPFEQQWDRSDLQLGTTSQLSDRGSYSKNPCGSCGEYFVEPKRVIGFKKEVRQVGKNVMQGKKRGQTKGGAKKGSKKGY